MSCDDSSENTADAKWSTRLSIFFPFYFSFSPTPNFSSSGSLFLSSTTLSKKGLFFPPQLCKSAHLRVKQNLQRAGCHEVSIKEWYVDKWQRHGLCDNKNTLGDIYVRGPHFTASKMQKHQELRSLSVWEMIAGADQCAPLFLVYQTLPSIPLTYQTLVSLK